MRLRTVSSRAATSRSNCPSRLRGTRAGSGTALAEPQRSRQWTPTSGDTRQCRRSPSRTPKTEEPSCCPGSRRLDQRANAWEPSAPSALSERAGRCGAALLQCDGKRASERRNPGRLPKQGRFRGLHHHLRAFEASSSRDQSAEVRSASCVRQAPVQVTTAPQRSTSASATPPRRSTATTCSSIRPTIGQLTDSVVSVRERGRW